MTRWQVLPDRLSKCIYQTRPRAKLGGMKVWLRQLLQVQSLVSAPTRMYSRFTQSRHF